MVSFAQVQPARTPCPLSRHGFETTSLARALPQAIQNGKLVLYFQPIQARATNRFTILEALVRWHSSRFGLVMPSAFIPHIQNEDAIACLGEWVLQSACEHCLAWQRAGQADCLVSVNVSVKHLANPKYQFVAMVQRVLQQTGVSPSSLILEITESEAVVDPASFARELLWLREQGVTIALDDFGMGYASLRYLRDLPIDTIKLDLSLVQKAACDPWSYEITAAIVQLAHRLNLPVIGEGAETQIEVNLLHALNCDYLQGYFLAKPMPLHEAIRFLEACNQ